MNKFCQIGDIFEIQNEQIKVHFFWNLRLFPAGIVPDLTLTDRTYYLKCEDIYKSSTTQYKFSLRVDDYSVYHRILSNRHLKKMVNFRRTELEYLEIRKLSKEEGMILALLGVG